MKQPKLSLFTTSKRRIEICDKKNDGPPTKKNRKEIIENEKRKKGNKFESKSSLESSSGKENITPQKIFSDCMKDAVKTICKICRFEAFFPN